MTRGWVRHCAAWAGCGKAKKTNVADLDVCVLASLTSEPEEDTHTRSHPAVTRLRCPEERADAVSLSREFVRLCRWGERVKRVNDARETGETFFRLEKTPGSPSAVSRIFHLSRDFSKVGLSKTLLARDALIVCVDVLGFICRSCAKQIFSQRSFFRRRARVHTRPQHTPHDPCFSLSFCLSRARARQG